MIYINSFRNPLDGAPFAALTLHATDSGSARNIPFTPGGVMKLKKTRAWLLSTAMTIGVAGVAPSFAFAADNRDREEWVKYEDVPREVKKTLDRERGNHDIKRIDHVYRDGKEFYRATIDTKGDDAVIRVSDSRKMLSRQEKR